MNSVSVVIPVFNSEGTLFELVKRLIPILSASTQQFEIIFVNDGSQDQSWEKIRSLCAQNSFVYGVNFMRNYGQHNALLAGILEAQYQLIITMDDDLQNPPEEIPKLLNKLNEGYDVVYGTPDREQHGLWRDMASRITKIALQRALQTQTIANISAFRGFRTYLRDAFKQYHSPFVSIDVLLTWATAKFAFIPVSHEPRLVGSSNYTFRKLVRHTFNMLTGFSTLPLYMASVAGFVLTILGLGLLLGAGISYLAVNDRIFCAVLLLVSVFTTLSGIQLFFSGLIGIYMSRMHLRIMERPVYAIQQRIHGNSEDA